MIKKRNPSGNNSYGVCLLAWIDFEIYKSPFDNWVGINFITWRLFSWKKKKKARVVPGPVAASSGDKHKPLCWNHCCLLWWQREHPQAQANLRQPMAYPMAWKMLVLQHIPCMSQIYFTRKQCMQVKSVLSRGKIKNKKKSKHYNPEITGGS